MDLLCVYVINNFSVVGWGELAKASGGHMTLNSLKKKKEPIRFPKVTQGRPLRNMRLFISLKKEIVTLK